MNQLRIRNYDGFIFNASYILNYEKITMIYGS